MITNSLPRLKSKNVIKGFEPDTIEKSEEIITEDKDGNKYNYNVIKNVPIEKFNREIKVEHTSIEYAQKNNIPLKPVSFHSEITDIDSLTKPLSTIENYYCPVNFSHR